MKTTVYRVQDREGRGPWRPGFSRMWVEGRPDHDNLPPWLVEFGPVHELVDYRDSAGAGCRTIEQLRRWFTPTEYAKLKMFGYQAVAIDVDVILGESAVQVFFSRRLPLNMRVRPVNIY